MILFKSRTFDLNIGGLGRGGRQGRGGGLVAVNCLKKKILELFEYSPIQRQ